MPPKKEAAASPADSLPSTTLIPNSALLRRFLTRLPKSVIVDLVLIWLDHPLCPIHQAIDEDDDFYDQEDETLADKKLLYEAYRDDSSITKKVIIDRILGIDWVVSLSRLTTATRIECASSGYAGYATSLPPTDSTKMDCLGITFRQSTTEKFNSVSANAVPATDIPCASTA
jgi:hypothetical protein